MSNENDLAMLSGYIDNELNEDETLILKKRLLSEPDLRGEYDELLAADKQLRQFAESIDRVPLPQDLADEFVEKPTGTQRYFAMAAALFLMLGGFFYLQNTQYEKVHLPALVSGDRVTTQSGYLEVVASFRNKNGGYCREVVSHSSHSVYKIH